MSELICPFCQQELVREGSDNYWCKKCNLERYSPALYGSQQLWRELIRTRKALNVAVDALKSAQRYICSDKKSYQIIQTAIEQTTALEQKDVK